MHAQSLDNMQCRRSAKNFALSYLSPNCCISCSVNNRWNFLRLYGFFFFALYFCSGTQDVLVSWKRRSLEEWKFEVPFVYNPLSLKHFNTCSFSGHNPIYYSRRNSFISCAESVMFEKNVTPWHTHYQSSTIQFVYSVKSGTDSRTIFTWWNRTFTSTSVEKKEEKGKM